MLRLPSEFELIAGAVVLAAAMGGMAYLVHHLKQEGRDEVTARVAAVGAAQAASSAIQEAAWKAKTEEVTHVAQAQVMAASSAAAAAARERDAARVQLDAFVRRRAVSQGASAPAGGTTADDGLLAELLDASWQRNLQLAREADERGIAGATCERWADSLKP